MKQASHQPSTTRLAIEQIRRVLETDRLRSLFYFLLRYQAQRPDVIPGRGPAYFEFGVGFGGTLTSYVRALMSFCRHTGRNLAECPIFGFDSFRGLPATSDTRDLNPMWMPGDYRSSKTAVLKRVARTGLDPRLNLIHFIEGTFDETLTSRLREELRPHLPSIITVDVDYFTSTKAILEWLRPILQSGTMFYFDDIWAFHGHPRLGELGAINNFNETGEGWLIPFDKYGTLSTQGHVFVYCASELDSPATSSPFNPHGGRVNDGSPSVI